MLDPTKVDILVQGGRGWQRLGGVHFHLGHADRNCKGLTQEQPAGRFEGNGGRGGQALPPGSKHCNGACEFLLGCLKWGHLKNIFSWMLMLRAGILLAACPTQVRAVAGN
jgi:hypothetical protein